MSTFVTINRTLSNLRQRFFNRSSSIATASANTDSAKVIFTINRSSIYRQKRLEMYKSTLEKSCGNETIIEIDE